MILEIALAAACSFDARLTALFTPRRPAAGHYDVCTTERALPDAVALAAAGGFHPAEPRTVDAVEAFGAAGPYDRGALNRLYDGRRVRVVRGWREDGNRFESLTFVSPYPNADFTQLSSGTLVIRLTLP